MKLEKYSARKKIDFVADIIRSIKGIFLFIALDSSGGEFFAFF